MDMNKLKQIQEDLIANDKKLKPKSKNWNSYTYSNTQWYRNTDEYQEYLREFHGENNK